MQFDADIVQSTAALLLERGHELGGAAGGEDAELAVEAGKAWFERDPALPEHEAAAHFTYLVCRLWRNSDANSGVDESPENYDDFATGSISRITSYWAIQSCRRFKFRVFGDFSRAIHGLAVDVEMCAQDDVACKKNLEECVGGCSGDSTSRLMHDFVSTVALAELNADVVGEDGFAAAHADCNPRSAFVDVQLFRGGDSFRKYAIRMGQRSGMNALPKEFQEQNPLSTSIIERAMERSPDMIFVNGRFRHVYDSNPPAPPPPPSPPPNDLRYGPVPPSPSPPPVSPPPYYDGAADPCTPIPTPAFFGIEEESVRRESAANAEVEHRSACLFVRRVTEKRIKAKNCFSAVLSPFPPPPPPLSVTASIQAIEDTDDEIIRGDAGVKEEPPLSDTEQYVREIRDTITQTELLLAQFGETQPLLKSIIQDSIDQMRGSLGAAQTAAQAEGGRRLMQREHDYSATLDEALVEHPIMTQLKTGIPGVDIGLCEALCTAISLADATDSDPALCRAFAHKRADPFSASDFTGRCYLLRSAGACKAEDFGARLLTRHVESEEICHALVPGLADELCVQIPTTRTDTVCYTRSNLHTIHLTTPTPARIQRTLSGHCECVRSEF